MDFEPELPMPKATPFQMAMTGDDWLSDKDKRTQAKAENKRKKAAIECACKLEAASKALSEYFQACLDCNDASGSRGADDSRLILIRNIGEYATYLSAKYDR